MSFYKITTNLGLAAIAFLALPLLASARPKTTNPETEKKTIQLNDPANVDGKTLAPGKYEVMIEGNKVSFEHSGEAVVTAPCDWKTMDHKSPYNSTTFSANRTIQEIQFEGSNQALEVM
jgi:hypothetical protein